MRVFKHIVFWIVIYIFFTLIIISYNGRPKDIIIENLVYLFIDISATYILLYKLLVPFILSGRVFAFVSRLILLYLIAINISLFIQFTFFEDISNLNVTYYLNDGFHSFLVLSTIFGWAVTLKLINEYGEIKVKKLELENQNVKNELKFLKSQINPHFLFNSLNNIDELIFENKDSASHAIHKLSGIMRYVLKKTPSDYIPLKEEIEFIQDFIQLAQYSFAEKNFIRLDISGNMDKKKIAPMLLITAIENTIKHSKKDTSPPGIEIIIQTENSQLSLITKNNIRSTQSMKIEDGIGFENLKRRLELLYPSNYLLDYHIDNNEFIFELKLQKL